MSDIRQFLRYEIPGYILFIYTFLLILPFIKPSEIASSLPWLIQISISGFIIAIPIGWLLYQIFNEHFIEMHYSKKSVQLIKEWSNEKNLSLPKYCYGELLNVGIYSSKNDENDEEISFDSQLAAGTLRGYWTNYEVRWIVAWPIPIISLFLAGTILFIIYNMELNPSKLYIGSYSIIIFFIILIMIIAISGFILKPNARIMNEINALEKLLVLLRKNQINKTMEIYKKYFMEERKMDSTENTPDLNKCPLSVESWVTILNNEIYNLRYPDLAVPLSPILIFSIAFLGYTIESIDGPLESVFVSFWAKIMGALIVLTVIVVIYFIICSYKTHKIRKDFETLREKIIFEDLTDSNIIREEWKKVRDSRFCLL